MMKPGIGTYDRFKQMFERFSKEAGKEQYLIPYFIAAHPGTTDYDMMQFIQYQKCFHRDAPDIILCFRWIMQSDGLKQKFIFWHYLFLL